MTMMKKMKNKKKQKEKKKMEWEKKWYIYKLPKCGGEMHSFLYRHQEKLIMIIIIINEKKNKCRNTVFYF